MEEDIVHRRFFLKSVLVSCAGISGFRGSAMNIAKPLQMEIDATVAFRELNDAFCWFHPRAAAIPGKRPGQKPRVIMTLQKHLKVSDYYSGLYYMDTKDLGKTWSGPHEIPELKMYTGEDGFTYSVADVTPGWHDPSKKLLAIGIKVKYGKDGKQWADTPLSHNAAYAVFDPETEGWSSWKTFPPIPPGVSKFFLVNPGCVQWLVKKDGTILLPVYYGAKGDSDYSSTVLHCSFDGENLTYLSHGDELFRQGGRGYVEPSLAFFNNRYFLTLRNDLKAYVCTSADAKNWSEPQPWTFDDGSELGSYNTQAHWLVHKEGLFLSYTRRGANNEHIVRNRAPIFIARVDPERLCVLRESEQILIPERGVMLGNFGASFITPNESWVTDAEFMIGDEPDPRGADGSVWVAKVKWSKPNKINYPQ